MSAGAEYSYADPYDGILSVGDRPFAFLLPEPIESSPVCRVYPICSFLPFDSNA